MNAPVEVIENTLFEEISIGQTASLTRQLTQADIAAFAAVTGDSNPEHTDAAYASQTTIHEVVGHGMWTGSLISTVLGTRFPGAGTLYRHQSFQFLQPVHVNDTLTVTVQAKEKHTDAQTVLLDCRAVNQHGVLVLRGEALVRAPERKVRQPVVALPQVQLFNPEARMRQMQRLVEGLAPVRCGVVHPCDESSLRGALEAAAQGHITPLLFGPEARIRLTAEQAGLSLEGVEIIPAAHSHEAAQLAVEWAAAGRLEALMKGSLHTDELMHAVVTCAGLRTKRRISHVFRFDVPLYSKPLLITDAALNIRPTLMEKKDIVQNAVDLSALIGCENPKVALLSAVETVNPSIPSTLDAAALCKMADRGQIVGARLDGPLAFDNAISPEAVRIKHIESAVAGDADILVVPDLESGNMLAKQLDYLAGAAGCGVVLGARVPIALTSRADGPAARRGSALLVQRIAHHYRSHKP